jgi:hypothetical protein
MRVITVGFLKLSCPEEKLSTLLTILCACKEVILGHTEAYTPYVKGTKHISMEISTYSVGPPKEIEDADTE